MRVQNRGSFSYSESKRIAEYYLYDVVNNKRENLVTIKGTKEECLHQFGLAQKEYYKTYPKLLPKGIIITPDSYKANFRLFFTRLDGKNLYIGCYITLQEAIQAKRDFIAYNIE